MSIHDQLNRLNLTLPDLAPTHEFQRVSVVDDLAFVSGHAPFAEGHFLYRGKIGREFDLATGQRAAASAVLGCLASLHDAVGSLDVVRCIRKMNGYVNCVETFEDLPRVTDGASRLLIDLFGEAGRHARTTVGVMSLPMGVAVEVELVVQLARDSP